MTDARLRRRMEGHMATYANILEAVGRTPLIRLNRIAAEVASPIYAKVEALNPGGSGKDRVGAAMIEAAEQEGFLHLLMDAGISTTLRRSRGRGVNASCGQLRHSRINEPQAT